MNYPNISLIMPIADRNNFKRLILNNLNKIDYDKNKLEFIMLDDGKQPFFINNEELQHFKKIIQPIQFIYKYDKVKKSIGHKRNLLVKMATNNYIACLDSDDLYLKSYLKHSIELLLNNKYGLVCSPQMLFIYPHKDWLMTGIDCQVKRMGHEATFVFTKKYHKSMGGFAKEGTGEGVKMIDGMNEKFVGKTECHNCMVCICHNGNTVSKELFENQPVQQFYLDPFTKSCIEYCLSLSDVKHNGSLTI